MLIIFKEITQIVKKTGHFLVISEIDKPLLKLQFNSLDFKK